ncbi:hypothetical protein E4U35_001495 [Claviceps purpurea]|nr:hypothetical protein E4U35_001495 [Claviceps purpurea]
MHDATYVIEGIRIAEAARTPIILAYCGHPAYVIESIRITEAARISHPITLAHCGHPAYVIEGIRIANRSHMPTADIPHTSLRIFAARYHLRARRERRRVIEESRHASLAFMYL